MKKLLAVILSVICVLSCFAPVAGAVPGGGVIGEVTVDFFERLLGIEFEEDTPIGYGVIYDLDPLSGVSVVYKPSPSIKFENPGIYTVTSDTPLSIDYEFICWEDSRGNRYDAGDKIYVDGMITLRAVWVEKTDNDVRVARIIKTTFEALKRMLRKFFGILDIAVNFEPLSTVPGKYDLTLNQIYYEDTDYSSTEGNERVLLYIDSYGFKDNFLRIDKRDGTDMTAVKIELCTGWDLSIDKPINAVTFTGLAYTFSEISGPKVEDVLILPTTLSDGSEDIVSKYVASLGDTLEKGQPFYMTVTIGDEDNAEKSSLYFSKSPENGLEFDEYAADASVVFTLINE
ncbi:MAG: hypothetical protein IJN88_03870 [Clostridia bacterium]|nr:hypothetical protein [Clostridia bacterium]